MGFRTIIVLLLGIGVSALALRTAFLLLKRKPVLATVVASSLPEATRYGHRRMQLARIGDALSAADSSEPTEDATIRARYIVSGREHFKELRTVVRTGDRPDPTVTLWYDPADPSRATDKGISWLGLGLGAATLAAMATGLL